MIGIIAALDAELALLRGKLADENIRTLSGTNYYTGTLAGQGVVLAVCGVGKVNAALCAQTMCLLWQPTLIINTGVAGALAAGLHVGDVVIGTAAVQHDMDVTDIGVGDPPGLLLFGGERWVELPCDAFTTKRLTQIAEANGARVLPGVVATGDQFIHDSARKAWIVETFGAACCEMEGGAIAHVCAANAVPCAIVRAISDNADDGAAGDFLEFLPIAAQNGAGIVEEYLRSRGQT
ncbi:MAG: 5'-methylthioadenosine/adenosylhomocysteine nucleosidase [Oscillospiraceae bacterium]|nr:5'-methylthioadenosine/adenosylhomocysteine nucleosidase [Oscillospiraceae bacterium]